MKKGFTLIELLVVVLIIGVLSAIALPQYEKAVGRAKGSGILLQLDSINKDVQSYVLANGKVAGTDSWSDMIQGYSPQPVQATSNVTMKMLGPLQVGSYDGSRGGLFVFRIDDRNDAYIFVKYKTDGSVQTRKCAGSGCEKLFSVKNCGTASNKAITIDSTGCEF